MTIAGLVVLHAAILLGGASGSDHDADRADAGGRAALSCTVRRPEAGSNQLGHQAGARRLQAASGAASKTAWNAMCAREKEQCAAGLTTVKTANSGKSFKVVTVAEPPFIMQGAAGTALSGFVVELMDKVSSPQMANFSYSIATAKTANAASYAVQTGDADVLAGGFFLTASRAQTMDVSASFMNTRLEMVVKLSQTVVDDMHASNEITWESLQAPFDPFSGGLWLLLLFATINSALVFWLIEGREPDSKDFPDTDGNLQEHTLKECLEQLTNSWFLAASSFTKGKKHSPVSVYGKLFSVFFLILVMIVIKMYTANLAAAFTQKLLVTGISSINDLTSANKLACVLKGTAYGQAVADIYPQLGILWVDSNDDAILQLKKGTCAAWISPGTTARYYANSKKNCELLMVGTPFLSQNYVIGAARPRSNCRARSLANRTSCASAKTLSYYLTLLREGQNKEDPKFFERLTKKYFHGGDYQSGVCPLRDDVKEFMESSSQSQVTFTRLAGLFIFWLLGTAGVVAWDLGDNTRIVAEKALHKIALDKKAETDNPSFKPDKGGAADLT